MIINGHDIKPFANLRGADLRGANLCDANLRGADLYGANLRGADLCDADLCCADLCDADLCYANLSGTDLRGANLNGANLRGASLLCTGNMREIKTLQIERWAIGYTHDTLQIGCQRHTIDKWRKWDTPAGLMWVNRMDSGSKEWANKLLPLVLQLIEVSPATKAKE